MGEFFKIFQTYEQTKINTPNLFLVFLSHPKVPLDSVLIYQIHYRAYFTEAESPEHCRHSRSAWGSAAADPTAQLACQPRLGQLP